VFFTCVTFSFDFLRATILKKFPVKRETSVEVYSNGIIIISVNKLIQITLGMFHMLYYGLPGEVHFIGCIEISY